MTLGLDRPDMLWLLLLVPLIVLATRFSRRRLGRVRWMLATSLRLALLLALVFALSELTLRRPVDHLAVMFVVDRSASVGAPGEQQAVDFVRAALAERGPRDQAGLVVFGAEALVDRELQEDLAVPLLESRPSPHQTDIAAGVRLGTALLPSDRTRRLVVLSDGEQTRGDAAGQVQLTAGEDLEVLVVPLGAAQGPEVLLEDLIAPSRAQEGAAYEVRVVARADVDARGVLRLYQNERYLGEMPVTLEAGRSRVLSFRQQGDAPGLVRYRAVLEVDAAVDARPENNQVMTTVQIAGKPRVLIVEREPAQARSLATVLEADGLEVDVTDPAGMPAQLSGLRPYAAVFLSDVPAYAMARQTQEALEAYVRDLGRGLVMLGGDQSFGLGGWYRTAVERALPVRMDIEDKARFPKLAMMLAVDKSCSMGGSSGDSKLALAKEAALQTADLLSDRDLLGVVSFDGASSWITPLEPLGGRRDAVYDDVASLRSGGGTDVYPAVDTSIRALRDTDAALKHIILLSDGMTTPGAYEPLIGGAHQQDLITLTAVAIGSDADTGTMRDMARWGGGNHYVVTDKDSIPAIFTRETLLATRSFLVEEPFVPRLASASDLTRGLQADPVPELGGYVATEAKQRAVVAMATPGDPPSPVLAHWRYGLGRAVVFTSDAKGRWGNRWVGTSSYTRLWTQVGRWVADSTEDPGVAVDAEIREGELVVTVDALDETGAFRNFLRGQARVVAPNLQVHPLDLRQVGPGRYEARMPVDQDGSWLAGVQLTDGEQIVAQSVAEAVQPYSPEYRRRGAGEALLAELGRVGGGGVTTDPAAVFLRPEVARQVPRPLWPPLVVLAALLLLLDVAARRLDFGASPSQNAAVRPAGGAARLRWTRPPKPSAPSRAQDAAEVEDAADTSPPAPDVHVPEDSYAGRLLAARRKARDKLDRD